MKNKILLLLTAAFLTACRFVFFPADGCAGKYDVQITADKTSYRSSPPDTLHIRVVNRSACNIFYQSPGFFATLQRLEKGRWKDLGPWYDIVAIVPRAASCAPGDSIPLLYLTTEWENIQKPGTYAVYLKLFRDKKLKHALPGSVCRSGPFKVVQ